MSNVNPKLSVRILGRFVPSSLQSEIIEAEIKSHLPACCQRERVSVRIPDSRVPVHPDNLEWHQDGGGKDGTTRHMVVWASEMPTEIRREDGAEWKAEPFDLILFDNTTVFHRQPQGTNEGTRWFLAVRCSGNVLS